MGHVDAFNNQSNPSAGPAPTKWIDNLRLFGGDAEKFKPAAQPRRSTDRPLVGNVRLRSAQLVQYIYIYIEKDSCILWEILCAKDDVRIFNILYFGRGIERWRDIFREWIK